MTCNAVQVNGRPLAAKPDLTSLLRCRWAPTLQLQPQFVLKAACDVAVHALLRLAQPLIVQNPLAVHVRHVCLSL